MEVTGTTSDKPTETRDRYVVTGELSFNEVTRQIDLARLDLIKAIESMS